MPQRAATCSGIKPLLNLPPALSVPLRNGNCVQFLFEQFMHMPRQRISKSEGNGLKNTRIIVVREIPAAIPALSVWFRISW